MSGISNDTNSGSINPEQEPSGQPVRKKFIGVRFHCCNIYVRIYINKEGTGYEGRCPKCYRPVKFKIGGEGVDHRFFDAY